MRSNLSVINVYNKKNTKSKVVTQLLYGDTFKKLKKNGSWIKIKNDSDDYKGFIKEKLFSTKQKNTHKVYKVKYYKGLGTSTSKEAQEYFKNPKIIKNVKINIVKIAILNPETKIIVIQVEANNRVCPRSG